MEKARNHFLYVKFQISFVVSSQWIENREVMTDMKKDVEKLFNVADDDVLHFVC